MSVSDLVRAAPDGIAALDALAGVAPARAVRAAAVIARRALAVVPPRPAVFLSAERAAGWDRRDEACVEDALLLCDELAAALTRGDAASADAVRSLAGEVAARLAHLWDLIVGDADAWDYDLGAAAVSVVSAALRAFTLGDVAPGAVVARAAWLLPCEAEGALATDASTWDARCRLREIALRDVVLAIASDPPAA